MQLIGPIHLLKLCVWRLCLCQSVTSSQLQFADDIRRNQMPAFSHLLVDLQTPAGILKIVYSLHNCELHKFSLYKFISLLAGKHFKVYEKFDETQRRFPLALSRHSFIDECLLQR